MKLASIVVSNLGGKNTISSAYKAARRQVVTRGLLTGLCTTGTVANAVVGNAATAGFVGVGAGAGLSSLAESIANLKLLKDLRKPILERYNAIKNAAKH